MKIFLCGQRTFGKEVCRALLAAGHEIVGVAPAPPQKRKDKAEGPEEPGKEAVSG